MSDLLAAITSQSADSGSASFAEVTDLVDTVVVGSASSVVLMMAVVPLLADDSSDEAADFRFAIDDVLVGPEITAFKDNIDEGCGVAICWAATGLSGSTKFALQWRNRQGTAQTDTGRVRSLTVVEITDASLLLSVTSQAADDAVSGYTDIVDLTGSETPASASSVLLMLGNVPVEIDADDVASFQFTVGGVGVGPEAKVFTDEVDEGCGASWMWLLDGESGLTAFAAQWDEIQASISADTGRVRSFQVIEITAAANILTAITSVTFERLSTSYADVDELVDTVTVDGADSILIFTATVPLGVDDDSMGAFRFYEGGTGEGPEQFCFMDATSGDEGCGHSVYWAATGKSAGSHTFSLRGQEIQAEAETRTDLRRSFTILELTAAVGPVEKDAIDTVAIEVNEQLAQVAVMIDDDDTLGIAADEGPTDLLVRADPVDTTGLAADEIAALQAGLSRLDALDLSIIDVAQVVAVIEALDTIDLAIDEATGQIAVMVDASDNLDLALAELAQLLALLEVTDTLSISIDEAAEVLALISRSDTIDLAIDDAGQVTVGITAQDDVDLAIVEGPATVVVGIAANDTLNLAIVEQAEILAFLQRADTLNLALVEGAPVILASLSRDDTLGLEIVDVAEVTVPITALDTVDLAIGEAASVVAAVQATDILDLDILEQAEILGILNRSDIADLAIQDEAAVAVIIQAVDDLGLAITDEVIDLCAALLAEDTLDLSIGEVAQVIAVLQATDQLDLAISEVAAEVVPGLPFEGVIVQPFTLTVCKEVKFTLQIEGSGTQTP